MKIYVAAPWSCKEQAQAAAAFLEAQGHQVVSRWMNEHGDAQTHEQFQKEAYADEEDVYDCEVLILLNLEPSRGKETELGMARAWGKYLIGVGDRNCPGVPGNVFYHWSFMHWVPDLESALALLQ